MIRSLNFLRSSVASPRQRYSVLLATLLLTILQVVAVSHLIGHSASGDTGGCELCVNAVHGGDALIATAALPPAFHVLIGRLIVIPEQQIPSRTPAIYRARGPPSFV